MFLLLETYEIEHEDSWKFDQNENYINWNYIFINFTMFKPEYKELIVFLASIGLKAVKNE